MPPFWDRPVGLAELSRLRKNLPVRGHVKRSLSKDLELLVTLWPSFPHFANFSQDERLAGIRLNSAMMSVSELGKELELVKSIDRPVPLFFDVKGHQLRVETIEETPEGMVLGLNHRIEVKTPLVVLFKAGEDRALLTRVEDDGRRLVFDGWPEYEMKTGESLHLRHPSLVVHEPFFTEAELTKIAQVRKFGFKRYFISFVESEKYVDAFLELVGKDSEVWLKIESEKGLEYVATKFKKRPNLRLVAACGDMYVEIDQPHNIMVALKLVLEKDKEACVGSRMLLSIVRGPVPELADFLQLAWLYEIGYRSMMLCDELCLRGDLLSTAVNVFDAFRQTYTKPVREYEMTLAEDA